MSVKGTSEMILAAIDTDNFPMFRSVVFSRVPLLLLLFPLEPKQKCVNFTVCISHITEDTCCQVKFSNKSDMYEVT